jgi:hypothetical protein
LCHSVQTSFSIPPVGEAFYLGPNERSADADCKQ